MKVLLVNAVYGHGSTGTIVRDIEGLCDQSGIECYVASPDANVRKANHGYLVGNFIDHKLHALLCRINGRQAYFSHFPTWNLCRYIGRIKPDIVHLHNLHSNYIHLNILLDYLAKKDIKTIITFHDCWFYTGGCFHYTAIGCEKWKESCGHCPKKRQDTPSLLFDKSAEILKDRKKYLLRVPHLTITGVSQWMSNEPRNTFLKDVPNKVIYNGIDLNAFKPLDSDIRERLGLTNKYIILGPASKWLQPENYDVYNYFTTNMAEDEVLLLYGMVNGTDCLPANVVAYKYIESKKELAELYTCADVFANPTREDSLSLINLEAQACGTPVVTFDATGPKETVDGINSFYVEVGNYKQLYKTIQTVKNKTGVQDIQSSVRDFVYSRFNLADNYKQYIDLYNEIYLKK